MRMALGTRPALLRAQNHALNERLPSQRNFDMTHSTARRFTTLSAILLSATAFGCSDGTSVNGRRELGVLLSSDVTEVLTGPDTVRAGARANFVVTTGGSNRVRASGANVRALNVVPSGSTTVTASILIEPYDYVSGDDDNRTFAPRPRSVFLRIPARPGTLEIVVRGRSRSGPPDILEIRDTVVIIP